MQLATEDIGFTTLVILQFYSPVLFNKIAKIMKIFVEVDLLTVLFISMDPLSVKTIHLLSFSISHQQICCGLYKFF